jgi:hypothetical protein
MLYLHLKCPAYICHQNCDVLAAGLYLLGSKLPIIKNLFLENDILCSLLKGLLIDQKEDFEIKLVEMKTKMLILVTTGL